MALGRGKGCDHVQSDAIRQVPETLIRNRMLLLDRAAADSQLVFKMLTGQTLIDLPRAL
jgi:hypothetical protein